MTSPPRRDDLFAALNVGTGEVFSESKPTRDGDDFLAFLQKAVKPRADRYILVVFDDLSTNRPSRKAWLEKNAHVHFTLHWSAQSSLRHMEA